MNRTHKYRAYDLANKQMVYFGELKIGLDTSDRAKISADGDKVCGNEKPEWVLMRFTGFQDIKNKDAYQGDIIKILHFIGARRKKHYMHKVIVWSEKYAMFKFQHENGEIGSWLPVIFEESLKPLIVGSVYTHKHLLEAAE